MVRTTISGLIGFILVIVEGWIIIKLKNYSAIDFGGIYLFMIYWMTNSYIVYTLLVQLETAFINHSRQHLPSEK